MRYIIIALITCSFSLQAQQKINVFPNYAPILIFQSDVSYFVNGNQIDYIIEKDPNAIPKNRVLTIRILPESNTESGTNVTVFTEDGNIYHFDLVYTKPKILVHHIGIDKAHSSIPKDSIKSEKLTTEPSDSVLSLIAKDQELEEVKVTCIKTENRKKRIFQTDDKSYNVQLSLKDIGYSGDKIFIFLEFRNKGGQAYDIEYMHFFRSTSESGTITMTNQKERLETYFIHNEPQRIGGKVKHEFIVVIDKTSINENKAITVRIKEQGGERDLNLNISDQIVNNPIKL